MHAHVGGQGGQQEVLMGAPRFHHLAPHTVAVNRAGKLPLGNGKADLQIACTVSVFRSCRESTEEQLYRKNRKRFPGMEKRMNMLLALEPLIYFESMTNGKIILRVITSGGSRQIQ